MHKTPSEATTAARALTVELTDLERVEVVICPPFTDLVPVYEIIKDSKIKLAGQNMHWEDQGAFTGEISAKMLKESGCEYVIIGHSERRHRFGEKDDDINKKIRKALDYGLKPIFCVGEKLEQRKRRLTQTVVEEQIRLGLAEVELSSASELVVAYEPVWAIGTGENATPTQAEEAQRFIRKLLAELFSKELAEEIRIQYGGSVNSTNAEKLLSQENVDGALVGGASLDVDSFSSIIKAAEKVSH